MGQELEYTIVVLWYVTETEAQSREFKDIDSFQQFICGLIRDGVEFSVSYE